MSLYNVLVYCHPHKFEGHFEERAIEQILNENLISKSDASIQTINTSGNPDILADGFDYGFVSTHQNMFDIVHLPNCNENTDFEAMYEMIITVLPIVKDGGLLVFGKIFSTDIVSFDAFVDYLRSLQLIIEPKYYDINNTIERFVGIRKSGVYQPPVSFVAPIELIEPAERVEFETVVPYASLAEEDRAIHKQIAREYFNDQMLNKVDWLIKKSEEERDREITKARNAYENKLREKEQMKHSKQPHEKIKQYYLNVLIPSKHAYEESQITANKKHLDRVQSIVGVSKKIHGAYRKIDN